MKIIFLDVLTFGKDADLSAFDALGDVTYYDSTKSDLTSNRVLDAEVIVTNKVVITKEMMLASKNLKLICVAATVMNNIDLDAAKELNIPVKNVAGYSTQSVVQHTFSMLLYLIGSSRYYDEYVKDKSWQNSDIFTNIDRPFGEISGKKWGIIGFGEIGKGVAKVADAFGAKVCYHSTSGKNHNTDYPSMALDVMLSSCDIITIHAALNDDTLNLLHYENMSNIKDKAVLINVGRGGIVNEADLAKIISEKDIFVGVDVTSSEPIAKDNPLADINSEKLYITPHIAWTSIEARKTLIATIVRHIESI